MDQSRDKESQQQQALFEVRKEKVVLQQKIDALEADLKDLRALNEKMNGNLREAQGESAQMRIAENAMKEHLGNVKKELREKEAEVRDMSV